MDDDPADRLRMVEAQLEQARAAVATARDAAKPVTKPVVRVQTDKVCYIVAVCAVLDCTAGWETSRDLLGTFSLVQLCRESALVQ